MTTPVGGSELDPVAPPRLGARRAEVLVPLLLLVAAGLITTGFALLDPALGFITGGVLLAVLAVLLLIEA